MKIRQVWNDFVLTIPVLIMGGIVIFLMNGCIQDSIESDLALQRCLLKCAPHSGYALKGDCYCQLDTEIRK